MSLSGSVSTSNYDGRYYTLSWTATQSIANNQSTVSWTLSCAGGGGWYAERTLRVAIAGSYVVDKTDRVERRAGTIASGELVITHNNEGGAGFHVAIDAAIFYSSVNCTAFAEFMLDTIPRQAKITSAPDFTDEDNPTIYFTNPAGNAATRTEVCISLDGSQDNISYRPLENPTDTSYTFKFTEEERNILRQGTLDGKTYRKVIFYVTTWFGNTPYYSTWEVTFTVVDCKPMVYTRTRVEDDRTINLTGNDTTIIKGVSDIYVQVTADALKGASIMSTKITCGSETYEVSEAHFSHVDTDIITVVVTDNRGNEVPLDISLRSETFTYVDYIPLTCDLNISPPDGEGNLRSTISGYFFDGWFGDTKNELTVEYRYREINGDYPTDSDGEYVWSSPLSLGVYDNGYSAEIDIIGLDYQKTYIFQARARDYITVGYIETVERAVKTKPTFDWGENDFNFNVPIFKEGNPVGYYPIGGIYTSSDNTDPGVLFGGTWELERRFYGGELLAYGTAWNSTISPLVASNGVDYGFSDILPSSVYSSHLRNYMPDILTASSGTIWVQTKGVVGLIEATVEISGSNDSCNGIWFLRQNKNNLPDSVTLTGGQGLIALNGAYTGASTKYFYNINDNDAGTDFFINPVWRPYGGSFYPGNGGTASTLQVKAYAKGKITYMWKRVA